MARLLSATARLCYRRPGRVLGWAGLLLLLALGAAAGWLRFSTDQTQLLNPREKVQRTWQEYRDEFGQNSDFVVLIQNGTAAEREEAVEALARSLERDADLFESPLYRVDLSRLARHALYYLPPSVLRQLSQELESLRPWLGLLARSHGLKALGAALEAPQLKPGLPALKRLLVQLARRLEGKGPTPSLVREFKPEIDPALGNLEPGQTSLFLQLPDGRTHLLLVRARDTSGAYSSDVQALDRLRQRLREVMQDHPRLSSQLSGEPVINTDEMVGARQDALRALGLATLGIGLLLSLAFRAVARPQLVMATLLVGLGWSCGFAAITVGKLNLLTINFATVLLGLGLTFGIQILYRYQDERSTGLEPYPALERTLVDAGGDNLVGALTTAVAFWALAFTRFRAAAEMGIITGAGVLLCYLAMLTVLPSLLILHDRSPHRPTPRPWARAWLLKSERSLAPLSRWVLLVSVGLTLYSATWVPSVPFDYNLLHLAPVDDEGVHTEHFLQSQGYSSLFALSVADGPEQARQLADRLESLTTVSRVESAAPFLPADLDARQPWVERLVAQARSLVWPEPLRRPPDGHQLELLRALFLRLQAQPGGLKPTLDRLQGDLEQMGPGQIQDALGSFGAELTRLFGLLREQQPAPPDLAQDLPEGLRERLLSPAGKYCLRIFPRANLWEREPLQRFVHQVRQVDPNVTGPPMLVYTYLNRLRAAYSVSGRNALIVIAVLLLLHFRSLRRASLAMFPKLLGVLWMIGVMGAVGAGFNAANFMALPLTLGIGLLFGVQVVQQSLEGHSLFESSSGPTILLSGLTTMVGFACLMTARHRGIASLGLLMMLGVGTNLATSLVVLPAVMRELLGLPRSLIRAADAVRLAAADYLGAGPAALRLRGLGRSRRLS